MASEPPRKMTIDKDADTKKAIDIAFNGKTRRYGVCNATETLLVHAGAVGRITLTMLSLHDIFDKIKTPPPKSFFLVQ
jgi:gamma-glutamyl phosphate reductase